MNVVSTYNSLVERIKAEKFLGLSSHFLILIIRVKVALIFLKSGIIKVQQGWDETLDQFENLYQFPVPEFLLPASAGLGMMAEILFPILLIFGLFTRVAAIPLLAMTLVIQYALPYNELYEVSFQNPDHYYWMLLLGTLIIFGAKNISCDFLLNKKFGFKKF